MIAEKYTDYMYNLVDKVITDIGPRESCGDQEKALGRLMARELEPKCYRVDMETFTCSPKAFLGFFPFLVAGYIIAVVFYFIYPYVSLIISLILGGVLFYEVVRYHELIDFLYPKREGENVAGVIKPRGEVKRRVIVSAHLDSAYEFKVWYWFKGFAVPVMALAFAAPLILAGASFARAVAGSSGMPDNTAYNVLGIVCIALSVFVLPFAFFHTGDVVPGAMDNMAGISVVAGLGKYLRDARESGEYIPQNTEVVLLCLSSEEAGLRGAKRYAARHREELAAIPTFGIFLDNINDERYLTVFRRELFPGARLDPYLVKLAQEAARSNGLPIKTSIIPVGASDASAFALADVPAVSILCHDTSRLMPNYHTRYDTIEHVRPQALTFSLQVVMDMLKRIDQG
jgi:hypothetical protein